MKHALAVTKKALVSGKVTGDFYLCDRGSGVVIESEQGDKSHKVVYTDFGATGEDNCKYQETSQEDKVSYALNEMQICQLFEKGCEIESIFGFPQDIEAVFSKGRLYILQSRNITT